MKFSPIHFKNWIEENRHLLKPPVCNKEMFKDGEFIVQVVGGPNTRKDYHYEDGPEFFYQIEGDMILRIMENEKPKDISIREGEMYLLSSRVPHLPIRRANTVGLVIERIRRPEEKDAFMWFCEKCHNKLYEEFINLTDIVIQLPPIFERFYQSVENRTCKKCKSVMEPPQGK